MTVNERRLAYVALNDVVMFLWLRMAGSAGYRLLFAVLLTVSVAMTVRIAWAVRGERA